MSTLDTKLKEVRAEIDKLDDTLLTTLIARAKQSLQIGKLKTQYEPDTDNILNPHREQAILERLQQKNQESHSPLSSEQIQAIFELIMKQSKDIQAEISK